MLCLEALYINIQQYEDSTLTLTKKSGQKNTDNQNIPVRPIRFRLLVPLTIITLLLIGLSTAALLITQQRNQQQFSRHLMLDAGRSLEVSLKKKSLLLSAVLATFLQDNLREQDRDQLLTLSSSAFQKFRDNYSITHLYFHRPDLINLARIHKPEKYGDHIDRSTTAIAQRQGTMVSGIELGPLGTFTLRVVQPIFVAGTLIGFVEIGQEIEGMLDLIRNRLGVELVITFHKRYLERQQWEGGMEILGRRGHWDRCGKVVLSYSTISSLSSNFDSFICSEKDYGQGKIPLQLVQFDNKSWEVASLPLRDISGTEVGNLVVL